MTQKQCTLNPIGNFIYIKSICFAAGHFSVDVRSRIRRKVSSHHSTHTYTQPSYVSKSYTPSRKSRELRVLGTRVPVDKAVTRNV